MRFNNESQTVQDIDDAIREGLRQATEVICQRATTLAQERLEQHSGAYVKSITTLANQGQTFTDERGRMVQVPNCEPQKVGDKSWELEYGIYAPYAAIIEEGSVAHDIPNAFGMGITVRHPGTDAYNILQDATDQSMQDGSAAEAFKAGFYNYLADKNGTAGN